MPHQQSSTEPSGSGGAARPEPKKLVLCFDGTGNTFSGSNADTNVVKMLNKLDRNHPRQHHYYQTGVGTYDVNERSVHKSWYGELRSSISKTVDQAFGTTFDAHVMAGYRFLMRYYDSGDKIYMFGFSRGAFAAKFLARMIFTVGLLCQGNEEMVPFAYRLYQRYLAGEVVGEVYFLGIWDCVNSVAVLENTAKPVAVRGTASYVRHAVAVDERRVKFKAALLAQDLRAAEGDDKDDIREVWFPGCHGDVGGGWPAVAGDPLDNSRPMTVWQSIRNFWTTRKPKVPSADVGTDPFQMSDVPLAWMIRELERVGEKDPTAAVKWSNSVNGFKRRFRKNREQSLRGVVHDSLRFGHGTGFFTVLLWKCLGKPAVLPSVAPSSPARSGRGRIETNRAHLLPEVFPFITRWELVGNRWVNIRFPLNKGSTRDIPPDAVLHESLLWRLQNNPNYGPLNNHGDLQAPCLKHNGVVARVEAEPVEGDVDADHATYRFAKNVTEHTNGA
ncbi:hypothetical protein DCS_03171 [Drechmeria coniospora]|uniref:T6SS Phospholipase effector Tle1-like catalytic domain-containing protein n=1 Tax=Drechmeria coniospora TaxID=98403 RepID=A0A151GY55_DRECN|nr:hypothetical protein DCS_03171 [Drechmeria coniospora]KYK62026.1 hypothetical protein DCS_03171 [Drechmeria coniospora]